MAVLSGWKMQIAGKMMAEKIKDFSDAEIKRVFEGCVSEALCIKYANELIASGKLTLNEVV